MRSNQSKQTRNLLIGLGVVVCLALFIVWTMLARRSTSTQSLDSGTMAAGGSHGVMVDGATSATDDAQRDLRASAAADLGGANAAASPAVAVEMVEVLVIDRANNKPAPHAELVYWAYTQEQERDVETWTWLNKGEFDAHFQQDIETLKADADGKALVKKPKRGAIVIARVGELWGYGEFRHVVDSPWRLEVVRDGVLSARVVDARDAPVGGASVTLRFRSGEWFWDTLMVETRESDGIAILPHAGYMLHRNGGGRQTAVIALGAVLDKPVEVALDQSNLPRDPVKLVLPSTGACAVIVVGPDGEAFVDKCEVSLRQCMPDEMTAGESPNSDRSGLALHGVRGGRALFRHITPGIELIATVTRTGSSSSHTARGPGPTAAGRTAEITVRLGQTAAIVRGRALDQSGAAHVSTKLRAWVQGEKERSTGSDHTWQLESDAQGRFHVDLRTRTPEEGACTLELVEIDDDGTAVLSASRPLPAHLPPGVHELGDFTLLPATVLASGRVIDGDNKPVRNARVELSIKNVYGKGENDFWWQQVWNVHALSDAEGRFVVRGSVTADALAISAQKEGSKADAVLVARGATDIVLRMLATGEIAGRVLLDPSLSKGSIQLTAERTDADPATDVGRSHWSPASLGDDGGFLLRSLRPGVYTVSVKHAANWNDLHAVEGVRVDSGVTTRDPRLDPLDLRTGLVATTLTIVDPEGQPVMQGMMQVTKLPKTGELRESHTRFENGKCTLTHDGGGVDLVIFSAGFRDLRIEHVNDDRVVTLSRAPRLKLVLAGGQRPPEKPFWLGVSLTPADNSASHHSWSTEESYFDARGQLSTFAPAVGRFKVGISITYKPNENRWMETGLSSENDTIIDVRESSAEQVFEIACDAAVLAAKIEELRKDGR